MFKFSAPVPALAAFSQISAETLRTWQRAESRAVHCEIVDAAYRRSVQDADAVAALNAPCDLKTFAHELGFKSPYPAEMGVPPTTLRQWEKDGLEFRLRVFLLGSQTLHVQKFLTRVGIAWAASPISPAQTLRLLFADPAATEALFVVMRFKKAA